MLLFLLAVAAAVLVHDLRGFEAKDALAYAPYGDSLVYQEEARRHFGPRAEEDETPRGAFYKPPLYTAMVAAFDAETDRGAKLLRRFQLGLGLLTLAGVFLLARARGGDLAGVVGALLLLGYAPLAFHQTKQLDTIPSLALTTCAFVLLDRLVRRGGGAPLGLLAGLLLGASALARAANLVFLLLVFCFPRRRTGWRAAVPFVVAALLPVTWSTLRNHHESGDWIPVNYSEGHTFLVGNHPNSRGIYALPPGYPDGVGNEREVERAIAGAALGREPSPSEQRDHSYRTALGYVKADPAGAVRRGLDKLRFAVDDYSVNDNYSLHREQERLGLLEGRLVPFPLLLILGLAGFFARRSKPRWPLAVPIAATFGLLAVFYVSERYRLPAAPFLAASAGVGVAASFARDERRRVWIGALVVGSLWLAFARVRPLPHPTPVLAQNDALFDLSLELYAARTLVEKGDHSGAARSLARAVADYPGVAALESEFLGLLHGRGPEEVAEIAAAARAVAPGRPRLEALLRLAGAPAAAAPVTDEGGR